jgi:arylsulfatase A-like enzyme
MVRSLRLAAAAAALALASSASQPNIVLVVTDDQDVDMGSLDYMPTLRKLLTEQGATFTNMYAAVPVCCPSRSR